MELFKFINLVDVDTKLSVLKGMGLQFSEEHPPAKVQYGCPDNFSVFDYLSPEEFNALEENRAFPEPGKGAGDARVRWGSTKSTPRAP